MINSVGRHLPEYIESFGKVKPFAGAFVFVPNGNKASPKIKCSRNNTSKMLPSIKDAIKNSGLKDGMTVSFHHHLRNGDKVVNLVMQAVYEMGIKDIHLAATGLFSCHEPLLKLIDEGVITKITTDTFNPGPLAVAVSEGRLENPAVLMSHGGRPRAIESGELHIDVVFIAAPSCDEMGNINGTKGKSACGYLSYIYPDAEYADVVIAVTDDLSPYPNYPVEISQDKVDYVVIVDSIGDPSGIVSGSTRITTDPVKLRIAKDSARLMDAAGIIKQEMSFQTGAGGASLATAAEVHKAMVEKGITGSFGVGGIHAYFIKMMEEGLFRALLDVQCFDLEAVRSAGKDPNHVAISASMYANPHNAGCVVNGLDAVILGATEIDLDFNVNVITGSDGVIIGASGGHSDTAAGAKLTIIAASLTRKNICVVRDSVTTITTPGETVDALVTEYGIAINPLRSDLLSAAKEAGLPVVNICELKRMGEDIVGAQSMPEHSEKIVGIVEYRDGTVLDMVYQVKR